MHPHCEQCKGKGVASASLPLRRRLLQCFVAVRRLFGCEKDRFVDSIALHTFTAQPGDTAAG